MKNQLKLLVQAGRKAQQDQVNDLAAAIAFWAFFSIFPLLIGILSISGYFLQSENLQAEIFDAIADLIPGSADLVKDNIDKVVLNRGSLGIVGLVGLLIAASKGFGAVTRAVNRAIGSEQTPSFFLLKFRYFMMALAVTVLSIASVGVTVFAEIALKSSLLSELGLEDVNIPRINGTLASFLFVFLVCALVYKLTPHMKVGWLDVLPGAFLAATLLELGKICFIFYLEKSDLSAIYGSLSSIFALLLWLYVSAVMLVFGVEYNIVRYRSRSQNTQA